VKIPVAFVISCLLISWGGAAGDWIEQGDSLDRQFKSAEALAAYKKAAELRPNDTDVQRKIAKQYVELVLDAPSRKEKVRLAQLGYNHALKAKELAPGDAEVRLTVGIAAGRLAFYTSDPRRKLELSQVTRNEAQEAIKLRPRYALAWHVLGRWHYELANLNGFLRMLAETIYGRLPAASNEESIRHLERAVELEPNNAIFHAELGRAYLAVGRKDEAKRELLKSLTLPQRNRDDAEAQSRAKQALRGL
jgi:tetratricopeptide (TPR) repeat protein